MQFVPSSSPLCKEDAIQTFISESSAFISLILSEVSLDTWDLFTTGRKSRQHINLTTALTERAMKEIK